MLSQQIKGTNMAQSREYILAVDHVTMKLSSGENLPDCKVLLEQNQIRCIVGGASKLTVPLSQMSSIQIHQPIFGANYISGEYTQQGQTESFTMTFTKGGATDFARAFFRLTEGRLVTDEQAHSTVPASQPQTSDTDDKKNR